MNRLATILVLSLLTLSACSIKAPDRPVMDLVNLAQDAGMYHGLNADTPLLSSQAQAKAFDHFMAEHFGPWERSRSKYTPKELFWGLDVYATKAMYGENTLRRDPAWMKRMRENSLPNDFPSLTFRAIAVNNTSIARAAHK